MIGNLQVLRALAALGVVFYHTAYVLPGGVHTDFAGVSIFFVISGFIMCHVAQRTPERFFRNRLLRIVPLYWLCTIVLIGLSHGAIVRDDLLWTIKSLLFLSADRFPVLGVGWTLNFEMYFYLVFAAALLVSRRFASLIAAAVVGLALLSPYAHPYMRFFPLGIGLYFLSDAASHRLPRLPTALLGAAVTLFCFAAQAMPDMAAAVGLSEGTAAIIMPVAIVASAVLVASAAADIRWRPLLLLGDASYALYLTHTMVMPFAFRHVDAKASFVAALAVSLGCLVIGVATHLWIERPLGRLVRAGVERALTLRASVAGHYHWRDRAHP